MNEPPNEKDAQRGNSERPDEATPTTSPSTEVWVCGMNGRVIIHPTIPAPEEAQVAQDQPTDCFAVPQRSTHWRDTLRRDGKPRCQTNGRRSAL